MPTEIARVLAELIEKHTDEAVATLSPGLDEADGNVGRARNDLRIAIGKAHAAFVLRVVQVIGWQRGR